MFNELQYFVTIPKVLATPSRGPIWHAIGINNDESIKDTCPIFQQSFINEFRNMC